MGHDGSVRLTEAQIKGAYQAHLARRRAPRGACPSPEAIQALVRREGDEAGRLATLDHVMTCGECRAELDLFRRVLGADVTREQHIASGDRCCEYRIAGDPARET